MNRLTLSALCGLAGAINNNGKTENTDRIFLTAVRGILRNEEGFDDRMQEEIHAEKFVISPNCESCKNPCGNTSDYDMTKFDEGDEATKEIKTFMLYQLGEEAARQLARLDAGQEAEADKLELLYKGISWFGYDLTPNNYEKIIADLAALQG